MMKAPVLNLYFTIWKEMNKNYNHIIHNKTISIYILIIDDNENLKKMKVVKIIR